MFSTEEELQKIYENNLSSWKKLLNGICVSICDRLQAAELKFTSKVRIKSLESLYAKKQRLNDEKIDQDQKIKDLLGLRFIVPFLDDAEQRKQKKAKTATFNPHPTAPGNFCHGA